MMLEAKNLKFAHLQSLKSLLPLFRKIPKRKTETLKMTPNDGAESKNSVFDLDGKLEAYLNERHADLPNISN